VIDSAAVDARRKLVIIRRDNVEHLLMIGGPSDVVVETNIVRAASTREAGVRNGADIVPRAATLPDPSAWPLQPEPLPAPVSAPAHGLRAERGPRVVADDSWQPPIEPAAVAAPPVRAVRPADTLAGLADELSYTRPEPVAAPRAAYVEPPQPEPHHFVAVASSEPHPPAPAPDQSLAEMAQRLEAALRRPTAKRVVAESSPSRVAPAPEATREPKVVVAQPRGGAQPRPQIQPHMQPQSQPQSQPQPQQNNLEQEMASLLSRPGKT
jgi:hypothetical protein